ncbi:kinesin-like protein KIF20A [Oscarella lobularis]|uniref:kinesin-like protein KIF20A n=1 Tax=Oscarella lobularis TaxID=121494 RepID=UPI00331349F1
MEPVKQKLDFSAEELESDPVRVFLRVKPSQGPSCLQLGTGSVVEAAAPKDSVSYKTEARLGCRADHRFTFSTVFAPETSQKNVFDETALPALWRFIRGEQAIVFTYGVTNSGKTFTMQGSSRDPGILPRSFDVLYNTIGSQLAEPTQVLKPVKYAGAESCDAATEIAAFENLVSRVNEIPDLSVLRAASSASHSTLHSSTESFTSLLDRATRDATTLSIDSTDEPAAYTVWMSYTEIYNGAVFDLLEQPMVNKRNKINPLKRKHLTVGRDRHGNTYVRNLKRIYIRNSDDAIKVLMVVEADAKYVAVGAGFCGSERKKKNDDKSWDIHGRE